MAIGISFLFGIVLPFNFDAPYKSRNIIEFWRRWHITLSRFLRDYSTFRSAATGTARSGAVSISPPPWSSAGLARRRLYFHHLGRFARTIPDDHHEWLKVRKRSRVLSRVGETPVYAFMSLLLTQLCVVVAWVFFRADTLSTAGNLLAAMGAPLLRFKASAATMRDLVTPLSLCVVAAGYVVCFVMPNVNEMFLKNRVGLDTYGLSRAWSIVRLHWSMKVPWAVATAAALSSLWSRSWRPVRARRFCISSFDPTKDQVRHRQWSSRPSSLPTICL